MTRLSSGVLCANGFCLPKSSLECSPNCFARSSQSLRRFFGVNGCCFRQGSPGGFPPNYSPMAVLHKKFFGEFRQLRFIFTWNPNDLYFWRLTPQNKAFSNQNKGHFGSRYIYLPVSSWGQSGVNRWHVSSLNKSNPQKNDPSCHRLLGYSFGDYFHSWLTLQQKVEETWKNTTTLIDNLLWSL